MTTHNYSLLNQQEPLNHFVDNHINLQFSPSVSDAFGKTCCSNTKSFFRGNLA